MSAGDGAYSAEAGVATLIATRLAMEDLTGEEGKLSRPIRDVVQEVLSVVDNKLHYVTLEEMEKDHADFLEHWKKEHPDMLSNIDLVPPGLEKARTSDWRPPYQIIVVKADKDGTLHVEFTLKAEKPFTVEDVEKAAENAKAQLDQFPKPFEVTKQVDPVK